jgi:hypothetical protein
MPTPDLRWLSPATQAPRAPRPPHAPRWPAAAAAVVGLGLLLAFQQVVAQAVAQGELRRSTAAARVHASASPRPVSGPAALPLQREAP